MIKQSLALQTCSVVLTGVSEAQSPTCPRAVLSPVLASVASWHPWVLWVVFVKHGLLCITLAQLEYKK